MKSNTAKNASNSTASAVDVWKKAADGLAKIDVQKYMAIDERDLKIYETKDGELFNKEVIDK